MALFKFISYSVALSAVVYMLIKLETKHSGTIARLASLIFLVITIQNITSKQDVARLILNLIRFMFNA